MDPVVSLFDHPGAIPGRYVLVIFAILAGPPALFSLWFIARMKSKPARRNTATVIVLGDIGRSPRMMYHAENFAKKGWDTSIVGYNETQPIPSLLELPHVHIYGLSSPPSIVGVLPWPVRAPLRVVYQIASLLHTCFFRIPIHTEVVLVQNPPAIPTLVLALFVCLVTGSRLMIDWHNTGWTILAMRLGKTHPLVKIARWYEGYFGQSAYAHLFVTRALRDALSSEWDLDGRLVVLHDRPPPNFRRTPHILQHELFHRLTPGLQPSLPKSFQTPSPKADETLLTELAPNGMPVLRKDRPALVVSSTSWTADEDFSLLLTALDKYHAARSAPGRGGDLPRLFVVITGKGALRAPFEKAVRAREGKTWTDVAVRCAFLEARDYPILLGSADLGVSLHTSSSGLDLPMKVVDMFGCGVPVLAKGFPCIGELVKDGKNGRVFDTGEQLGQQLIETLSGFPTSHKLDELRGYFSSVEERSSLSGGRSTPRRKASTAVGQDAEDEWSTWDQNWERIIYQGILARR